MTTGKTKYRVLVVSSGDKTHEYFSSLLPPEEYELISHAHNAGEARRLLLSQNADIVIINSPLPDEFGTQLALDLSDSIMGIMLVVKSEHFERITHLVEDSGVSDRCKTEQQAELLQRVEASHRSKREACKNGAQKPHS